MSRTPLSSLLLCKMMAIVISCSSGDSSSNQPAAKDDAGEGADGNEGDGDYVVVESAPLGLLDPAFLARVGAGLETQVVGRYDSMTSGTIERASSKSAVDSRFALAIAISTVPGLAAGEAEALINSIRRTVYEPLFGAAGLLGTSCKILAKDANATSSCTQIKVAGTGAIAYVDLCVDKSESPPRFSVDLYSPRSDGQFSAETRLQFSRDPTDSGRPASIDIQHRYSSSAASQRLVSVRYPQTGKTFADGDSISVSFGDEPFDARFPRVSLIDYAEKRIDVALAWQPAATAAPTVAGVAPRYYTLSSGDIEIWQTLASGRDRVQYLAFLPGDAIPSPQITNPALFDEFSYHQYMMEFLAGIVTTPSVNAACAETGDAFRSAFSGKETPTQVRDAPNNLCVGSPGVDTALIAGLVAATCGVNVGISLNVTLPDVGNAKLDLCAKYVEAIALQSPQNLKFNVETNALEITRDQLPALADWRPPAFDFSTLLAPPKWEERVRPGSYFATARNACPR